MAVVVAITANSVIIVFFISSQNFLYPIESRLQYALRSGYVNTHESLAALAEHLAVVEGKAGALDEEVNELLVVEAEVAAVEPYEEGGLRAPWFYLWDILAAVVHYEVDVAFNIA